MIPGLSQDFCQLPYSQKGIFDSLPPDAFALTNSMTKWENYGSELQGIKIYYHQRMEI